MTGLDPERSEKARQEIARREQLQGKERKEFIGEVKGLGAMLHINGLRAIYHDRPKMKELLNAWLTDDLCPISCPVKERPAMIEGNKSRAAYRQATEEAAAFAAWLKRWQRALLPDTEDKKSK